MNTEPQLRMGHSSATDGRRLIAVEKLTGRWWLWTLDEKGLATGNPRGPFFKRQDALQAMAVEAQS